MIYKHKCPNFCPKVSLIALNNQNLTYSYTYNGSGIDSRSRQDFQPSRNQDAYPANSLNNNENDMQLTLVVYVDNRFVDHLTQAE